MDTQALQADISFDKPNPARVYDYILGGFHNFAHDRQSGEHLLGVCPEMRFASRANRAFLRRAVRFLSEQGIDQFLDLGSGIPTCGNVHEIAQAANPSARVVYVDVDPVAVAHSQMILRDNPNAAAIQADVRQPTEILGHAEVTRLFDLSRPAAMLFLTILHFVVDNHQAYNVMHTFTDALVSGSYIAVTHATYDGVPSEVTEQLMGLFAASFTPVKVRTRDEIARFFDEFELVEPGLVHTALWHPEGPDDIFLSEPGRCQAFAGVGRKP